MCENISYILIDFKPKFKGKILREEYVRLMVCLASMLMGLILATRKGFYLIKLINQLIIFIPIAISSFVTYYCVFFKGDF